jgi:type IV secretion system protein VirB10
MGPAIEFPIAAALRAYTTGIRTSDVRIGKDHGGFMNRPRPAYFAPIGIFVFLVAVAASFAQEPEGPQTAAPAPVAPAVRPLERRSVPSANITVPAGTRVAVVLENGISTHSAKAGDSLYFRTSFPITQNNQIVIPVGSYLRGELLESKRPGRIKGRGEFRMRLNTLILPNGYTVDLNAVPRSADSGGKETMDPEGKVTSPGGKGKDVETVATTTATGAGIGAIAAGGKGAGIGAGIGGLAGLGAVLLTRGPEAELPRGSTLDIVLEHALTLDGSQIQYRHTGEFSPITPPPARPQ